MAVSAFVEFCVDKNLVQPPDKIVKNLCTFICQDAEQTPTFAFARKFQAGILSFSKTPTSKENGVTLNAEEVAKARLSRRGAAFAFVKLSRQFGPRLLDAVPRMWQSMAGGLLSACSGGP